MINVFLFFYLIVLAPKLLIDRLKGKRHPDFLQRLGLNLPKPDRPVIWIHAVSVGEVKATQPLFEALNTKEFFFLITTTTATGQAEAKRTLARADAFAYLPIDFSWVVKKFVKIFNPKQFILVESDFWPNLLSELKKNKTVISLVSGKMSKRSQKRFGWVSRFSKRLFSLFDHICVQNEEYYQRFLPFVNPSKLHITGNLKLDLKPVQVPKISGLSPRTITIGCTHEQEEALIIEALRGGDWTIFLAPRHPERFEEVAQLLYKKQIPFTRWSQNPKGKLILVDAMGQLPICYTSSRLAILGGSFIEGIGGHNVLEPLLYQTPVLFGPHMENQREIAKIALSANAGMQICLPELRKTVEQFFHSVLLEKKMCKGAAECLKAVGGATQRTVAVIRHLA